MGKGFTALRTRIRLICPAFSLAFTRETFPTVDGAVFSLRHYARRIWGSIINILTVRADFTIRHFVIRICSLGLFCKFIIFLFFIIKLTPLIG
ncbi:hypothetical protein GDO86_019746 [Hymenochirus boettgeri]|uniref:Uncharacterized protein n=1 Tax=Hymenochirus boettgeri TaxID=247094 RepID=A0A8T2IK53_9PIPI|nr:hypothetical protein GDO86_019746 [Hymenochirus boettgeri]